MPDAIAPYNFVPLADKNVPGQIPPPPRADRYDPERRSGWIELQLTTRTPTYVRAAKEIASRPDRPRQELNDGNGQPVDFFHRGDRDMPVIPGSTLRGMFRNIFEILTWSRMEQVSPRRLFYRSFADVGGTGIDTLYKENFAPDRFVAGMLYPDGVGGLVLRVSNLARSSAPHGFVAVPANDPAIAPLLGVRNGERAVNVTRPNVVVDPVPGRSADLFRYLGRTLTVQVAAVVPRGAPTPGTSLSGHLVLPGRDVNPPRHWYQVIVDPGVAYDEYEVPASVLRDYEEWGKMAHGAKFGTDNGPRYLKAGQPAFALLEPGGKTVSVLSANMMMHLRYGFSVADVVQRYQDELKANDEPRVAREDMTHAVFGFVPRDGKDTRRPVKSRVAFEDVVCRTAAPWLDEPQVRYTTTLGAPKPTAFPMYLEPGSTGERHHWSSPEAVVRGYKRYWHRSKGAALRHLHAGPPIDEGGRPQSQNMQNKIRPVRDGVTFTGRVRFTNLSDAELGALLASIQLPAGLAHKVGMGKNLGLGSVEIAVAAVALIDWQERYASLAPRAGIDRKEYRLIDSQLRSMTDGAQEQTLSEAYQAFCRVVLNPNRQGRYRSLWDTQRTRRLAALLSLEPCPRDADTRQISAMGQERNQWTQRYILPYPENVPGSRDRNALPADILPLPPDAPTDRPARGSERGSVHEPVRPSYARGQQVEATVLEIVGHNALQVRLADGTTTRVMNVLVSRYSVGQTAKFKVKEVTGDGRPTLGV